MDQEVTSVRGLAVRGVAWTAAGLWGVRLTDLVVFIVLSRELGPTAFGLVALAAVFVSLLSVVAETGFSTYLVQVRELGPRSADTAFWSSLALSVAGAAALALGAAPLSSLLGEPDLAPVLQWLTLGLVFTGLASTPGALLVRQLNFRVVSSAQLAGSLLGAVVALVMVANGAGVWALVAQWLVGGGVPLVVLWSFTRWRPRLVWDPAEGRAMTRFGSTVAGVQLVTHLRDRGDELLLGVLLGPQALGIWVVATRLVRVVIQLFTSVLSVVATPTFARISHDLGRLHRALRDALSLSSAITMPAMAGMAALGAILVPELFGEQWGEAVVPMQLMCLTGAIGAVVYYDRSILIAIGRPGVELVMSVLLVALHLAVTAVFARYGLVVLATALAVRTWLVWPMRFLVLRRVARVPLSAYSAVPVVLLSAGFMAGTLVVLVELLDPDGVPALAALVLLGGALYLGCLRLLAPKVWRLGRSSAAALLKRRTATTEPTRA